MPRALLLGLGLLLLATLAFICLRMNGPAIESDINTRTQQILSVSGIPDVSASISGRDVTLHGTAWSEQDRTRVEESIAALKGVRVVNNQILIVNKEPPATTSKLNLQIDYDGEYLAVTGTTASKTLKQELLEAAAEVVGKQHVAEDLKIVDGDSNIRTETLPETLSILKNLQFAQVVIQGNKAMINGYATTPEKRLQTEREITRLIDDEFDITFLVSAPELADKAPTLSSDASSPAAQPSAEEIREQITNCQLQFDGLMKDDRITFETASDVIDAKSKNLLDKLGTLTKNCPDVSIEIGGHTDTRGDASMNQKLSEKRAKSVRSNLISRGATSNQLIAIGFGEKHPIADESTSDGLQQNRRIEFKIKE